jgi:hypothetical protein
MKNATKFAASFLSLLAILVIFINPVRSAPTFHIHDQLISMFTNLCDNNPSAASYDVIGETHEGRNIVIFKIGNPNGGKVMWTSAIHGWEDLGSEVQYLIAEWLLTSENPEAQRILNRNYILFVPIVNMDSYERENRNYETDRCGVDLNRNFVTGWSYVEPANTGFPNSYHGDFAGSEKETQAIRNALQTYRPNIFMDLHYGGGAYLRSYGADTSVVTFVYSRIRELSSELNISFSFSMNSGGSGGNGMAVGDANSFGADSWLCEMASETAPYDAGGNCYWHTSHSLSTVETYFYPKFLLVFRAMSEVCESDAPTPTPMIENGFSIPSAGSIDYKSE